MQTGQRARGCFSWHREIGINKVTKKARYSESCLKVLFIYPHFRGGAGSPPLRKWLQISRYRYYRHSGYRTADSEPGTMEIAGTALQSGDRAGTGRQSDRTGTNRRNDRATGLRISGTGCGSSTAPYHPRHGRAVRRHHPSWHRYRGRHRCPYSNRRGWHRARGS